MLVRKGPYLYERQKERERIFFRRGENVDFFFYYFPVFMVIFFAKCNIF